LAPESAKTCNGLFELTFCIVEVMRVVTGHFEPTGGIFDLLILLLLFVLLLLDMKSSQEVSEDKFKASPSIWLVVRQQ